ncbi:MAG: AHH domain-containing protein [Erythrobacter sp.]|nr:AHH domain-containing protein [Erythrobacter sp.]
MQRHHLLPCQLLASPALESMFGVLGRDRLGFDDFRRNGLLLPASEDAARRSGLPLHRGPHRDYNGTVAERVGQIEAGWSREVCRDACAAAQAAIMRLDLLQRALRRRLLDARDRTWHLSRKDPFRSGQDYAELDAMAELLWAGTAGEAGR